jgi:hypothetical protein
MSHSWKSQILLFLLAALLPAGAAAQDQPQAHGRTYTAFSLDVPFKFSVGQRTFHAGSYQLIVLGPGLLALGDLQKKRIVATLLTRPMQTAEVPSTTKLIFTRKKGCLRLTSLLVEREGQSMEILGEEVAMPQNPPPAVPLSVLDLATLPPTNALRRAKLVQ